MRKCVYRACCYEVVVLSVKVCVADYSSMPTKGADADQVIALSPFMNIHSLVTLKLIIRSFFCKISYRIILRYALVILTNTLFITVKTVREDQNFQNDKEYSRYISNCLLTDIAHNLCPS